MLPRTRAKGEGFGKGCGVIICQHFKFLTPLVLLVLFHAALVSH